MTEPPAPSPDVPGTVAVDGSLDAAPPSVATPAPEPTGFQVKLTNFSGPFDVLLELIGKHKLDVTEVALHTVTDDFIAYIRAMGDAWDLDETSEFLVIAATLLDLKAARLLPSASVEDEEDLALLEARDLLFARLLQYKAFKEAAAHIAGLEAIGSRRYPRSVSLEPQYAEALPDLVLGVGPDRLLKLALKALTPRPLPVVSIAHIHQVRVSVREHAGILRVRLLELRVATFRALCADVETTLEVVARFLALLELYRENLVGFEQIQALGELTVRWIGSDDAGETIEVEEYEGATEPSPSGPLSVVDADGLGDGVDLEALGSGTVGLAVDDFEDDDADPRDDVGSPADEADPDQADPDLEDADDQADPDLEDSFEGTGDEAELRRAVVGLVVDDPAEDLDDVDFDDVDRIGETLTDDVISDEADAVAPSGEAVDGGEVSSDPFVAGGEVSSDEPVTGGDVATVSGGSGGDEDVAVGDVAVVSGDGRARVDRVDFGVGENGGDDAGADGNSDAQRDVSAAGLSEVGSGDLGTDDRRPGGAGDPDE